MSHAKNQAEKIKEISGVNPLKCMKCGKCSATCPAFNEMDIKPHQFVSYVQNGDIEALANSKSLWKCLSCFACVERCPRDVQPGRLIDAARQIVVRTKGQTGLAPEEIPELLDLAEAIIPLVKTNLDSDKILEIGIDAVMDQAWSYPIVQHQIPAEKTWSSKTISGVGSSLVMDMEENRQLFQSFLSEKQEVPEETTTKAQ